jgi:hypothetical protein
MLLYSRQPGLVILRVLCNGKTLAFQANDTGSIPVTRSSPYRTQTKNLTVENLSDRQAADAVRGRTDWKYALSLPLEDSGFNNFMPPLTEK